MSARQVHTATFLFTDIVNSTQRWEADAEAMGAALASHDALMAEIVAAAGGDLFKHTGDGILAMFPSAASAVAAAVAAQRRLELPVRMGLDSGEAESRDGDWFGPVLNRASRVMSAAHGGQVLVTPTVVALASRTDTLDLGLHRLRGLAEPVRLLQVCGDGLHRDFPPPRTPSDRPGNLPTTTAVLVGRDQAVVEVTTMLAAAPVVTLIGPGGVGKTVLAQRIADTVADEFPDGAWLVELAPVRDPSSVPHVVATTMGALGREAVSPTEALTAFLTDRCALVVLDNCEHVLDAAAEVAEALLARSPRSRIVATSREGLAIAGEQLWPVPTLAVDDGESAAVALFVERARTVRPDFELDDAGRVAVVEICRELDGLALAIELAAARMVSMNPQEVKARLDQRFRLLSGRSRGVAHHQTLEQTVSWSYDLLDEAERRLLDRCSVFADGFELDAAVAVGGDGELDTFDVLDLLDSLVRKSLLTVDRSHEHTRYRMLETIRQYAADRLERDGSSAAVHARHVAWFAAQARRWWERWSSPEQGRAIAWAEREFADLRAAFRWAADHDELAEAVTIAAHTTMIAFPALVLESVGWAREVVDRATDAQLPELPRLLTAASVCTLTGSPRDGRDLARRAQEVASAPGADPFHPAWMAFWELAALRYAGPLERWLEITDEMLTRDGLEQAVGLGAVNAIYPAIGRAEAARALVDQGLAAATATNIPFLVAFAYGGYGRALADVDPQRALETMRRAVEEGRLHGNRYQVSTSERDIAGLEAALGEPDRALELFDNSIEFYRRMGNRASVTTSLGKVAVVFTGLGRFDEAATMYGISVPCGVAILADLPDTLDQLRSVLGQVAFDRCVATGSAMEFEAGMQWARHAIARARAELAAAQARPDS
ncbi:MAG: NB-ARC domain-containing protein [Actinobacteria bacterium]|nr:NB-ARC domain-containing protein [Actinomycetota bacterium]